MCEKGVSPAYIFLDFYYHKINLFVHKTEKKPCVAICGGSNAILTGLQAYMRTKHYYSHLQLV